MLRLETDRLLLREFLFNDWQDVHEYACDPEVVRHLEWGPNSKEETIKFVEGTLACQREYPRMVYEFAVLTRPGIDVKTPPDQTKLIGACGLRLLNHNAEQAEIGYCFARRFWRSGFASEASKELLRFGFHNLGLHRMYATCDNTNIGSSRVLEKIGMRREGLSLKDKKIRGTWRDTLHFAILRDEWADINAVE